MKGDAAIYARYSDPLQREASIEDQVRFCREFAQRSDLSVGRVYEDKAITGAVRARPGYLQMIEDGISGEFGILIVHDLSRLSRDDYELKGLLRRLLWQDIRVIGAADGYDSARQGHKIHAGFKGLMNEMHLDDIRAWTLKGMRAKAEDGYSCGGRTFGYRSVPIEHTDGKKDNYGRTQIVAVRREIDEEQARVVRQIYAWYAEERSYSWIASRLNTAQVPSPRGTSWAASAIKVILDNAIYEGTVRWNRRTWSRNPDTGKRKYKRRRNDEWICRDSPELRIVDAGTVELVRRRQRRNRDAYGGPIIRPLNRRYLFSGILRCGGCGGNFTIVSNGRYGCAAHKTRGTSVCANTLTVSRHIVEERLLADIKSRLLTPSAAERFKKTAVRVLEQRRGRDRKAALACELKAAETERDNLLAAIKAGVLTPTTRTAMESSEARVEAVRQELRSIDSAGVTDLLPRAAERYQTAVENLAGALSDQVEAAREILKTLVGDTILIHFRGTHLEAELETSAETILHRLIGSSETSADSFGCGGPQCDQSVFISFAPNSSDYVPLKRRQRKQNLPIRSVTGAPG